MQKVLKGAVTEFLDEYNPKREAYWLQEDSCHIHFSKESMAAKVRLRIHAIDHNKWPAYWPKLTLLGFFIWPWLFKQIYRGTPPQTVAELRQHIKDTWSLLPQGFIVNAIEKRLNQLITNGGGHINKFYR